MIIGVHSLKPSKYHILKTAKAKIKIENINFFLNDNAFSKETPVKVLMFAISANF